MHGVARACTRGILKILKEPGLVKEIHNGPRVVTWKNPYRTSAKGDVFPLIDASLIVFSITFLLKFKGTNDASTVESNVAE